MRIMTKKKLELKINNYYCHPRHILSVEQNFNNEFDQDDRHQNNASTSNSYIDDVGSHYILLLKKEKSKQHLNCDRKIDQ